MSESAARPAWLCSVVWHSSSHRRSGSLRQGQPAASILPGATRQMGGTVTPSAPPCAGMPTDTGRPAIETDAKWSALLRLLGSIPKRLLAQAASQCGAHARALQYFEMHVRGLGVGMGPVFDPGELLIADPGLQCFECVRGLGVGGSGWGAGIWFLTREGCDKGCL